MLNQICKNLVKSVANKKGYPEKSKLNKDKNLWIAVAIEMLKERK